MSTVPDQFAEILVMSGVKRIYGVVGDSLNGIPDSIRRQGKIEWIHVRHEDVAAFALDRFGTSSGGPKPDRSCRRFAACLESEGKMK